MSYLSKAQAVRTERHTADATPTPGWDDDAADAAIAATLDRLRDIDGTRGDQHAADLWEAMNAAAFSRDSAALALTLRALEEYLLTTFLAGASAVLDELRRRGLSVTLTTRDDGVSDLIIRGESIPPGLLGAARAHRVELIDLLTTLPEPP